MLEAPYQPGPALTHILLIAVVLLWVLLRRV
jgi:hypothetical protein